MSFLNIMKREKTIMAKKNFNSLDSLQPVVNVINEANLALNDPKRTIANSAMPEVLAGALGAGAGGAASFAALYGLGVTGLSAAGITSGLAAAGALVGGGMAAGVFVLAAPVAILAAGGVGAAAITKAKHLENEKKRVYNEAIIKQNEIIKALEKERKADKERIKVLTSLNTLLEKAIADLRSDLGYA